MKTIEIARVANARIFEVCDLPMVRRVVIPVRVKRGQRISVVCIDDINLTASWAGSVETSLDQFKLHHPLYRLMVGYHGRGVAGVHEWHIGERCEDGYLVFVDDRPLSYRKTFHLAQAHAFEMIMRIQSDGDYRLNDKPLGFLPPAVPSAPWAPIFTSWRHGGWYVVNVRYRNGAVGCVSNNYEDRRWRIACDDRRDQLGGPGDYTFKSRDEAARAEFSMANAPAACDAKAGSGSIAATN